MKNYYIDLLRSNGAHLRNMQAYLASEIAGRRCLVVGSAPDAAFPKLNNAYTICINGSVYSLRKHYGSNPDLTFLNGHIFKKNDSYAEKTLEVLGDSYIGNVIINNNLQQESIDKLASIGTTFLTSFPISKFEKRAIVGSVLGYGVLGAYKHLPNISSGMFAVALGLWCGASEVVLVGFSLNNKHAYSSKVELVKRRHVKEDVCFLSIVSAQGLPVSTTSDVVSDSFNIPLNPG